MKITHVLASAAVCGALVAGLAAGGTASAAVPVRGTFTPVDPVRILDTRSGLGVADQHTGPLGAGTVIELDVTGVGGVPEQGAGAVVLNVTVTEAAGSGFVTAYPCGFARPLASNLNFVHGINTANQVTPKVGQDGRVCLFTSNETHLVADVSGWYADDFAAVPGFFYEQLTPARIVDTRDGTGLGALDVAEQLLGDLIWCAPDLQIAEEPTELLDSVLGDVLRERGVVLVPLDLGELDALPFQRAFVRPRASPFSDVARTDGQRLQLAHGLGGQKIADRGHARMWRLRA